MRVENYLKFLRFSKTGRTDFYRDVHQIIRIAKALVGWAHS
jgi:hypothetical protein